jgi:hypothetical protein
MKMNESIHSRCDEQILYAGFISAVCVVSSFIQQVERLADAALGTSETKRIGKE